MLPQPFFEKKEKRTLLSRKPWYIRPPIPLSRQALQGFFTITYYSETIKNFLCAKYKIKIAYFIRCTSIPKHGRERRENRNPDLMHSCCWIAKQSTYLCTNSIKKKSLLNTLCCNKH